MATKTYEYEGYIVNISEDEFAYRLLIYPHHQKGHKYKNSLSKTKYTLETALNVAENYIHLIKFGDKSCLLKYFMHDKDFIVSYDMEKDLYAIRYIHSAVDWEKPYMLKARGLVINYEGDLIITPYQKFFNYHQYTPENRPDNISPEFAKYMCDWEPNEKYEVLEKLDGSMIAMTAHDGELVFSTTQSVNSIYAKKAEKWVHNNLSENQIQYLINICTLQRTLLFEYVSPNAKIVLEYPKEELILHGSIVDGYKISEYESLRIISKMSGIRVAKLLGDSSDYSAQRLIELAKSEENIEGFVLRFTNSNKQIKIKTDDYLHKHRHSDLFFGNLNTKQKNLKILQLIKDDEIDDVMAEMLQGGHTNTYQHMQDVSDYYWMCMEELNMAKATVQMPDFNKELYFRGLKGKYNLKSSIIGLICNNKYDRIDLAIERHILKYFKDRRDVNGK